MRYTTALVLGTLAAGQAAAANLRHASFHARRHAESKRGPDGEIDWDSVTRDLAVDWSKVDWSKVDWSSVFNTQSSTPAPTPTPTPIVAEAKVEPTSEAAYTPAPASSAPEPTETKESSNPVEEIVNDITSGVAALIKKVGICSEGRNDESDNGKIWLGASSPWTVNFKNGGDSTVTVFCWVANADFTGMTLNVDKPWISAALKPGANQTVSFGSDVPASCAPVYEDTTLNYGIIKNTWLELHFPKNGVAGSGAFDVSKNPNMKGTPITAVGSQCTSSMTECYFACTGSDDSCTYGYELYNCNAANGGGGGYDAVMGGTGGGCTIPQGSECIEATLG